jgi:hypothetical protein
VHKLLDRANLKIDALHFHRDETVQRWSYRSTHSNKGALTLIWNFLYQNPNVTRGEAIKALSARGMNKGTIATQYQKWRHASDDDRRTRAGLVTSELAASADASPCDAAADRVT